MKRTPRTIGITFNLKANHRAGDSYEEYDERATITALTHELIHFGFKVVLLEQTDALATRLLRVKPDFVFNIAEGRGASRSRESQVPCLLESLNIPYSGSDPLSLALTLDKFLTHKILMSCHVPVPRVFMLTGRAGLSQLKNIFSTHTRLIVKPRWEGSSKGIFNNSIVEGYARLSERVNRIFRDYRQPALVEEFLEGDEVTVGVCGNKPARVLGMMRISPRVKRGYFLYSQENKKEWKTKIVYDPGCDLSGSVRAKLNTYALRAFDALGLRDISRIDFRLSARGVPKIIDVNALPGLSPHYSDLPILYRLNGGSYRSLIRSILAAAFARYGF